MNKQPIIMLCVEDEVPRPFTDVTGRMRTWDTIDDAKLSFKQMLDVGAVHPDHVVIVDISTGESELLW